eukprot:CAMPEP_0170529506 /NCGR_PEP_ID=MMETSP0209-20121228/24498_1 /TAXON_ID=665100 ORGANISM="Litonotus pictus, Strain P1" /NCGR_SAMPLE_ID=MMETSP0209 /ASSEMBLY_ACC=CAM_ASM_000301 /LENGTH=495 /DNA_ID=CAMNT_0010821541 /DNA_START=12 /DNA_END=1499 /DNA_ORIENTATION=-
MEKVKDTQVKTKHNKSKQKVQEKPFQSKNTQERTKNVIVSKKEIEKGKESKSKSKEKTKLADKKPQKSKTGNDNTANISNANEDSSSEEDETDYSILKILLGTYTGSIVTITVDLLEYTTQIEEKDTKKETLKTQSPMKLSLPFISTTFKSSDTMIKTIFPHKKDYIFTSGTDEIIRIYDITSKKEKGIIVSYSGTVSKIVILKKLLFAVCDNNLEVFKLKDFSKAKSMIGHKHPINSVLVHSTGKLVFTVGRDNHLMMWSVNKSKPAFKYRIRGLELISLGWVLKEKFLVVGMANKIFVLDYLKESERFGEWNVLEHSIKTSFDNPGKILDVKIYKEEFIMLFKSNFQVEVVRVKDKLNKISASNISNIEKDIEIGGTANEEEDKENGDSSKVELWNKVGYCTLKRKADEKEKEEGGVGSRLKFVEIQECGGVVIIVTVSSNNTVELYDCDGLIRNIFGKNSDVLIEENEVCFESMKKISIQTDRFTTLSLMNK